MELYFSPLACSTATRIVLYELGLSARFCEVDFETKTLADGTRYREVHPLGLVPALRTDDGHLLTENAAVLQYLASTHLAGGLMPADLLGRTRLQQWLSFIGMELHKGLFSYLLDKKAPPEARRYLIEKQRPRLDYLARHLEGRSTLLDGFSLADAYLFSVLTFSAATEVNLNEWPALVAYRLGLLERPSVARAFHEELALYRQEQARLAGGPGTAPAASSPTAPPA